MYASLSAEEKEAKLQNNRDYRQRKKEAKTSLTGTILLAFVLISAVIGLRLINIHVQEHLMTLLI